MRRILIGLSIISNIFVRREFQNGLAWMRTMEIEFPEVFRKNLHSQISFKESVVKSKGRLWSTDHSKHIYTPGGSRLGVTSEEYEEYGIANHWSPHIHRISSQRIILNSFAGTPMPKYCELHIVVLYSRRIWTDSGYHRLDVQIDCWNVGLRTYVNVLPWIDLLKEERNISVAAQWYATFENAGTHKNRKVQIECG
jgi:hypothetical protein